MVKPTQLPQSPRRSNPAHSQKKLTASCSQKTAKNAQHNQEVLAAWKQRNYWDNVRANAASGQYESAQSQAAQVVSKLGLKSTFLSLNLENTLATPTLDPPFSTRNNSPRSPTQAQQSAASAATYSATIAGTMSNSAATTAKRYRAPATSRAPVTPSGQAQISDASFTAPANWKLGKADWNAPPFLNQL